MQDKGVRTITSLDRVREGIVITFSYGVTAVYHTQFLYDVRQDDSNIELENAHQEE